MASGQDKLTCVALIVCDDVFRDERTKKLALIGTFNRISAGQFPCQHHRFAVFFTLTNGNGSYDLAVTVEHELSGVQILEIKGPLEVRDPLGVQQFHVEVGGLEFPEPGKYWVALQSDGAILQQTPIWVVPSEAGKEHESDG